VNISTSTVAEVVFTSEDKHFVSLSGCDWVKSVEQKSCLRCFLMEYRILADWRHRNDSSGSVDPPLHCTCG